MQELFPNITTQVADESDWINLCKTKSNNSAIYLHTVFSNAGKEAKKANNVEQVKFYGLLSQVFSMFYKKDDSNEPFGPMWVMDGSRSAIVTDFSEMNLDILKHLIGKSADPTVDSRLSDMLWLRRKNRADAETAIAEYLKHAEAVLRPDQEDWIYGFESLQRASQLWQQLGRPDQFKQKLTEIINTGLNESGKETDDYLRVKLLKIATDFRLFDDLTHKQQWTEKLATECYKSKHFDKGRDYLEASIEFARINKDQQIQERLKRLVVDYFVDEAKIMKASGAKNLFLADRFSKAIEAARRHGGLRELIDELHIEMNIIQEQAMAELGSSEVSIDVTKYIEAGREAVSTVSLDEALPQIARLANPGKTSDLRRIVAELIKKFPLVYHISAVTYNDKGRVVARTNPALATDNDDSEAAIKAQMIIECGRNNSLLGRTLFESARRALKDKFVPDSRIFEKLVENNPFVPQGREAFYIKGLNACLNDDPVACAHILIPQIEHSIRTYMEGTGKLVTRLTDDLTQKEHDLNKLLYEDATVNIFGEDMIFTLRALLVEELGGNYRNRLSHGLLDEGDFYNGWVNYLWAITIRLLWLGRLMMQKIEKVQQPTTNATKPQGVDNV